METSQATVHELKLKSANLSAEQNVGPIETRMRHVLSTLRGSRYPDSFDWSVYDRIAQRFGKTARQGTVFKTTLKLVNHHSSCTKCHYAFEVDTYGRGCVHNCSYCYAKEILSRHGSWNQPVPFPIDLSQLRKIFYTVFETEKPSKWREILEKRVPLRIGSMSDSFMWIDKKYKVSLEFLKILKFYKYPHIIFTRSDLLATDEYMNAMDVDLSAIQYSISGSNEELVAKLEPGAPSVKKRLTALKTLNENGFLASVRLNPFFPIYPDGYFSDPDSVRERFGSLDMVPRLDLFDITLLDQIKEAGADRVLAGFVRLSPFAVRAVSRHLETDFSLFFKPELFSKVGDSRYTDSEIFEYYRMLKSKCSDLGLRFSTCYIGMGVSHYYEYQNLWENKTDCCDVRGSLRSFSASSQGISWLTRLKHASCKESGIMAREEERRFDDIYKDNGMILKFDDVRLLRGRLPKTSEIHLW